MQHGHGLSEVQKKKIKLLINQGIAPKYIAERFNISVQTVSNVKNNRHRRHIKN